MKISYFFLFCSLIISGCATTSYTSIQSQTETIKPTRVKLLSKVSQSKIRPQIKAATTATAVGMQTAGLIGAAIGAAIDIRIDSVKGRRIDKRLVHYRELLADENTTQSIHRLVKENISNSSSLEFSEFITTSNENRIKPENYIVDFSEEKLLLVDTSYSFDPTFNLIHIQSYATLYLSEKKQEIGKKRRRYNTISWSVNYQTPRGFVRYAPISKENLPAEASRIRRTFKEKINGSPAYKKQKLEKVRDRRIRNLMKFHYTEFDLIEGKEIEIDSASLKHNLKEGIERTIVELVKTLEQQLTSADFNENLEKIPYANKESRNKAPYESITAHYIPTKLDSHNVYLTNKNKKYIIPKGETTIEPSRIR